MHRSYCFLHICWRQLQSCSS